MNRILFLTLAVISICFPSRTDAGTQPRIVFDVVDSKTKQPIPQVQVNVLCLDDPASSALIKTDAKGTATLPVPLNARPARLRITFRAPGFHPYHMAMDAADLLGRRRQIAMRPGKQIAGRVVDLSGNPIEGARATTTGAADISIHGYYYTLFDVRTDAEGRFTTDSVVSPKKLRLEISHPDFITQWIAGDEKMEVCLVNQRSVKGSVTNFLGQPIEGASVVSVAGDGETVTDKNGRFDLGMLLGSPIEFVVTADRLSPQRVTVTSDDDANEMQVRLLPGRAIRFRVTDQNTQPLSDVRIESQVWQNTQSLRLGGTTDENGQLTLRNAPADRVEFVFRRPGYQSSVLSLKPESERHEVVLHENNNLPTQAIASPKTEVATEQSAALDVKPGNPMRKIMHLCNIDGAVLKPLIDDVRIRHRLDRHGTPDVSADGSTIAFDAYAANGETWEDCRIIVANIDGTHTRDIGWGVIPSLSPDGSHVAYSRPRKHSPQDGAVGQSMWTMKTDGTDQKMIADNYAWGARWTADGRSIVFRSGRDDQGNYVSGNCLRVYDLQTEKTRNVFSPEESPFQELKFHLNVSRHGRLAVMTGTLRSGKPAIAVIDIDRGLESIRFVPNQFPDIDVPIGIVASFSHDNRWIAIACRKNGLQVGHAVHIDGPLLPKMFPRLPKGMIATDPTYTPDGKNLIICLGSPH